MNTEIPWENPRVGDHLGHPGLDGRILFKCIFEKWDGGHGLNECEDIDRWQALVDAVMNFRVPYNAGDFFSN